MIRVARLRKMEDKRRVEEVTAMLRPHFCYQSAGQAHADCTFLCHQRGTQNTLCCASQAKSVLLDRPRFEGNIRTQTVAC